MCVEDGNFVALPVPEISAIEVWVGVQVYYRSLGVLHAVRLSLLFIIINSTFIIN